MRKLLKERRRMLERVKLIGTRDSVYYLLSRSAIRERAISASLVDG